MIDRSFLIILLITACALSGCSGSHLVVRDDQSRALCRCMPLPNCVSSHSFMFFNKTSPFELAMPEDQAWRIIKDTIENMPRTVIVEEQPGYIHAKCTSLVFRFVDNLELLLNQDTNIITVRSSSTFALFDFEVNYLRIDNLRKTLQEKGAIR